MHRGWRARAITMLIAVASTLATTAVAAGGGTVDQNYMGANVHRTATQDAMGTGTADAKPTADRASGKVSASASTSSNAPAGALIDAYGYLPVQGLGGTDAFSYGEVIHSFSDLGRATHSIAVQFSQVTSTASASATKGAGYAGYSIGHAWSAAQADIVVEYYDCRPGSPGCSYSDVERVSVLVPNGTDQTLTLTSSQDSGLSDWVIVRACLVARAKSWGHSSWASSQISGRVSSITVR